MFAATIILFLAADALSTTLFLAAAISSNAARSERGMPLSE